ncbi:ABC transporter protein EcsB [Paenibacillus catalpae]|uniref:ABC transporter protein EcsB n=1 Tax=Paenibacillus catalpae TaxID=1045775 RepID=A0A1I2DME6_9BACL|nr:hypothetical protein [Paenibacillus catalpae]SFE81822.1 ABC transporter protein EcsB [Paenibacillus catalpae]
MLRTFNTLFSIRTSSAVNRLIYYAQKLPLVGRTIKDTQYANLEGKRAIAVIAFLLHVIWGFVSKLAFLGLMVYLPAVAMSGTLSQEDQLSLFLHIFLLLSFVAAGVASVTVLETKREKYIAVKLMRMKPAAYMQALLGYRYCSYFIYYLPAMLLFTSFLNVPILQGVALAVSVTLWRVFCEYVHLILFQKTGIVLIKNNAVVWLAIGIGYGSAYLPLLLNWTPTSGELLLLWPVTLVIAVLGAIAAMQLKRYPDYRTAVDAATKRDDPLLDIGRMFVEANKKQVESKDIDYTSMVGQTAPYKSREGYAYLNALFFARHRSLLLRPLWNRMAIIGALGVIGIAFAVIDPDKASSLSAKWSTGLPWLIWVMNFMSIGEKACKAIFYNCDLSLMRYSFYRNAAERHFRERLYRICGYNLALAALLGAALTGFALTAGGVPSEELLLTLICLLALAVFFSIHHLFLYYMLQPYSTELNMKNPFFFVVNFAVSMAFVLALILEADAAALAIATVAITIVYFVTALILVKKWGPRTFRVK